MSDTSAASSYWFVGAMWSEGDQTERFLRDGIWQDGSTVRTVAGTIQPGDRIAIKATYTRKTQIPFDNHGRSVSTMDIKATGTVVENLNDGRTVRVEWTPQTPPLRWYFFTLRTTVHRIQPDTWIRKNLIDFAFNGQPQQIEKFRCEPFWADRYGDTKTRFLWIPFFEELADKLASYKDNRDPLVTAIFEHVGGTGYLTDHFADGTDGSLKDICPFTTIGIFNRNITDANRRIRAEELKGILKVDEPIPESFEGIPTLFGANSWYFSFAKDRGPEDIDKLWEVLASAMRFAESDNVQHRDGFISAFDEAEKLHGVSWNLTFGLYWIRPWSFPSLDARTRDYLKRELNIAVSSGHLKAEKYLELAELLSTRFRDPDCPVHSFPELSLAAWKCQSGTANPGGPEAPEELLDDELTEVVPEIKTSSPYGLEDIVADGCFLGLERLREIRARLESKKNLILQGPPGTGKTWLAKRLGYALIGTKSPSQLTAIQFHPNLCYEDFVQGWRPNSEGKLTLIEGPLMEIRNRALQAPKRTYVLVIEEINRGNPAQIFGEILTLLEADKRERAEALRLSYQGENDEPIHLPPNLFVIGTMNLADRSLALVDLALRRRFAFVELEPTFGSAWQKWMESAGVPPDGAVLIGQRMNKLNQTIALDSTLGKQFRVGHSYVTPRAGEAVPNVGPWFRQIVDTEIRPLLEEYWFDNPSKADEEAASLLAGL